MEFEIGDIVQVTYSSRGWYGEIKRIKEDRYLINYFERKNSPEQWWRAKHLRIVARASGTDVVPQVEVDRPKDAIKKKEKHDGGLIFKDSSNTLQGVNAWNAGHQWVTSGTAIPITHFTHDQEQNEE